LVYIDPSSQINWYQNSDKLKKPKFYGKHNCYTPYEIMGNFTLKCALDLCLASSLPS
jgi:hypothetical protein